MLRLEIEPRSDWQAIAEANAFFFHHIDGELYWNESACYIFSANEIDRILAKAASEVQQMCLDLVDMACRDEEFMIALDIPRPFWEAAADSWKKGSPSLYGRMDFSYAEGEAPELLEYNADTPTSLNEGSFFQRSWFEDMQERKVLSDNLSQFNSIHDCLKGFLARHKLKALHLACMSGSIEDRSTIAYLAACAATEGTQCDLLYMEEIGLTDSGEFVDMDNRKIKNLFKLYPWEFIWKSEFGLELIESDVAIFEPPWKMLLSTKGILPLLWEKFPGHPNLLPARFAEKGVPSRDWIAKPLLGREGANIRIHENGDLVEMTGGDYADRRFIYQKLHKLPNFGGNFPVLGLWIVGDEVYGMGIGEDKSPITGDKARFVPHLVR